MASTPEFVAFIAELLAPLGAIRTKKMFGEYGFYINEKFAGVICDDKLFFKNTKNPTVIQPYPGATKNYYVSPELFDEPEKVLQLAQECMKTY